MWAASDRFRIDVWPMPAPWAPPVFGGSAHVDGCAKAPARATGRKLGCGAIHNQRQPFAKPAAAEGVCEINLERAESEPLLALALDDQTQGYWRQARVRIYPINLAIDVLREQVPQSSLERGLGRHFWRVGARPTWAKLRNPVLRLVLMDAEEPGIPPNGGHSQCPNPCTKKVRAAVMADIHLHNPRVSCAFKDGTTSVSKTARRAPAMPSRARAKKSETSTAKASRACCTSPPRLRA